MSLSLIYINDEDTKMPFNLFKSIKNRREIEGKRFHVLDFDFSLN